MTESGGDLADLVEIRDKQLSCSKNSITHEGRKSFKDFVHKRLAKVNTGITESCDILQTQPAFEKAILVVIVLNAAWIGVDIDWNEGEGGQVPAVTFDIVENIFCVLFSLELLVRFLAYKEKVNFFKEKWNLFDMFLVQLMILEVWILSALASSANLKQVSMLRLLRLLRLLRISRIFRMVPELGMMVKSLAAAARSVSSTFFLEIGLMYVFAVICTQWAKAHDDPCLGDEEECIVTTYFGSISKSLLSLLQILVFDDCFAIIRPLLKDSWYIGILLICFMVIGSFTVLNMLIGVICEIVNATTSEERDKILMNRVKEVFATIDIDGSGTVSRDEFNGAAARQLGKLGIEEDIVNNAFEILDDNDSGFFELENFYSMIFKLLHPPQTQDILKLSQKLNAIGKRVGIPDEKKRSSTPEDPVKQVQNRALTEKVAEDDEPTGLFSLREVARSKSPKAPDTLGVVREDSCEDATSLVAARAPEPITLKGNLEAGMPKSHDALTRSEDGTKEHKDPKGQKLADSETNTTSQAHPFMPRSMVDHEADCFDAAEAEQYAADDAAGPCSPVHIPQSPQSKAQAARIIEELEDILGEKGNVDKVLHFLRKRRALVHNELNDPEAEDVVLEVELEDLLGYKIDFVKAIPLCRQYINLEKSRFKGDSTGRSSTDGNEVSFDEEV